jgi:hypothetical protein
VPFLPSIDRELWGGAAVFLDSVVEWRLVLDKVVVVLTRVTGDAWGYELRVMSPSPVGRIAFLLTAMIFWEAGLESMYCTSWPNCMEHRR